MRSTILGTHSIDPSNWWMGEKLEGEEVVGI